MSAIATLRSNDNKLSGNTYIYSMNRLILIGNGFDLAHGLKTDYNSFIVWYLKKSLEIAKTNGSYEDILISVKYIPGLENLPIEFEFRNVSGFVNIFYEKGFWQIAYATIRFQNDNHEYPNPFITKFKSNLSERIIGRCHSSKWVDIENEFYNHLKECLVGSGANKNMIKQLNISLKFIIEQLELYLLNVNCSKYNPEYSSILNSEIQIADIIKSNLKHSSHASDILILNFNYTTTIKEYLKNRADLPSPPASIKVNYIHGVLNTENNPLIFGFGDELDEDYKRMELSKANEFFEYIKSFWYFKTSNYHSLIRFIDSNEYQIYILGHSCGLSDRTLLNMLFEHPNCKSIKIYYHGDKQKNNYTTLTQEISRHFRDKVAMRNKIVPFDRSEPMPQVE